VSEVISEAIAAWTSDVKNGIYPSDEESYGMPANVDLETLKSVVR
jgi:hypothetical protein